MTLEHRLSLVEQELAFLRAEYSEYTSAISHDFAGPLRIMSGFSEIILSNNESMFDEETKTHFDFIMEGAIEGKKMLDDLRAFSKLQNTKPNFREFDCGSLVASVLETLSEFHDNSDTEINVAALPILNADKELMHTVFYHLLKNALVYRDKNRATIISISCQNRSDNFEFNIIDNGIGIPDYMHGSVFRVLKRGVSAEEYPGRGMGLAFTRKLIRKHGGKIKLISSIPTETIFSFTIPKNPVVI